MSTISIRLPKTIHARIKILAAKRLGVTRKTLSALLNYKASLSPQMAIRVSKATKTTPESWLYMQAKLDLWAAEQKPTEVEDFERVHVM